MANKQKDYFRGLSSGLDMAYRILRDAGEKKAASLIGEEIRKRGKMPVNAPVTTKELEHGLIPMKQCLYETFLCQTLMVLRDEFGYGSVRGLRFLKRWNLKIDCMAIGLVNWKDYVEAISKEMNIDVPTEAMKLGGLI